MGESSENPLVDIGNVTVEAFNIIKNKEKAGKSAMLGRDETLEKNPNHKVNVYIHTPEDKQEHRYFHSLSIDKQVEDFMGTAEVKCPYDSNLMEYWEPIRNYCVIYGSNQGESNLKILFIGRVRELRQEGYELVITFQDYGWKFKQLVTQSYANDNVIGKNGYTIMKLMFEALKIDSWVISPSAKNRLMQVGFDEDGNVTLNKEKIEKMPDLIERLKASNPNDAINKYTITNKLKESEVHNVKNINYTLRYEEATPVMKKISSEGGADNGFTAGASIYGTHYGSSSGGGSASGGGSSNLSASGTPRPPDDLCSSIGNAQVISAMKLIWSFNRGYANDYSSAQSVIVNYATNSPQTYSSRGAVCLQTLQKYCSRKDGVNAASIVLGQANAAASRSGMSKAVTNTISYSVSNVVKSFQNTYNAIASGISSAVNTIFSWFK